MTYKVTIAGCDDSTVLLLTESAYAKHRGLLEHINAESDGYCQPSVYVQNEQGEYVLEPEDKEGT